MSYQFLRVAVAGIIFVLFISRWGSQKVEERAPLNQRSQNPVNKVKNKIISFHNNYLFCFGPHAPGKLKLFDFYLL